MFITLTSFSFLPSPIQHTHPMNINVFSSIVYCNADIHNRQNQAVVAEGAVRILRQQWTPTYKEQLFKELGWQLINCLFTFFTLILILKARSVLHRKASSVQRVHRILLPQRLRVEGWAQLGNGSASRRGVLGKMEFRPVCQRGTWDKKETLYDWKFVLDFYFRVCRQNSTEASGFAIHGLGLSRIPATFTGNGLENNFSRNK